MKEEKKYLEGTRIEDLRWKKFGKLTVIELDYERREDDESYKLLINNKINEIIKREVTV